MEFKCGASLIAKNAIITAAHCIKFESEVMLLNEVVVILGKHNLDDFSETGSQTHYAKEIIKHPDFMTNDASFDADIAIIILKNPVTYSQHIRPLCLWESNVGFKHTAGETGSVVGWGKDELEGSVKSLPSKLEMQIVSDTTCLRSHESFRHITSKRTFCAGNANYTGPCNGDSGGPFMMKRGGKWFLKGIISASPIDVETRSCDLSTYVVFTDVVKFIPWIRKYIKEV